MKVREADLSSQLSKVQMLGTIDDALEMVGDEHKFQWRQFVIMSAAMFTLSTNIQSGTYNFIQPPLLCDGISCSNVSDYCHNSINISVDRTNYKYNTVVTDYELWCDKKYLISIAQSSNFFGCLIGGLLMSHLGDKYGRKVSFLLTWAIACFGIVGIALCFSIYQYIIMNFIMGFGTIIPLILIQVVINESSGQRFRQKASVGTLVIWSLGELLAVGLYFLSSDWKQVWRILILFPAAITFISVIAYIKETPQYHLSKGNKAEVILSIHMFLKFIKILDYIAKVNKKTSFSQTYLQFDDQLDLLVKQSSLEENTQTSYNLTDLFRYRSLRYATFGFMALQFISNLIFFGGQYSISDISEGNTLYILGATLGLAELFGYLSAEQFISNLSRRKSMIFTQTFTTACCMSYIFFGLSPDAIKFKCIICYEEIIVISLACLIRFTNSFGYGILALFAIEFYPTSVRSLGTGIAQVFGVIGSFISPYSIAIAQQFQMNPYIIIGLLSSGGPCVTFLIKETLNKPLRDQIDEVDQKTLQSKEINSTQ